MNSMRDHLEIDMLKEMRDYSESIFFGLSMRQLIFAMLGVGGSLCVWYFTRESLSQSVIGWLCMLVALPFIFFGFFTAQGMTAEAYLAAMFRYLISPKRIPYWAENYYLSLIEASRKQEANAHDKNIEK